MIIRRFEGNQDGPQRGLLFRMELFVLRRRGVQGAAISADQVSGPALDRAGTLSRGIVNGQSAPNQRGLITTRITNLTTAAASAQSAATAASSTPSLSDRVRSGLSRVRAAANYVGRQAGRGAAGASEAARAASQMSNLAQQVRTYSENATRRREPHAVDRDVLAADHVLRAPGLADLEEPAVTLVWNRGIRISVAGLVVNADAAENDRRRPDLRVSANVQLRSDPTQDTGQVQIFNLARPTAETHLREGRTDPRRGRLRRESRHPVRRTRATHPEPAGEQRLDHPDHARRYDPDPFRRAVVARRYLRPVHSRTRRNGRRRRGHHHRRSSVSRPSDSTCSPISACPKDSIRPAESPAPN